MACYARVTLHWCPLIKSSSCNHCCDSGGSEAEQIMPLILLFLFNYLSLFPCFLIQWAWYSLSNTHSESESLDIGGSAQQHLAQRWIAHIVGNSTPRYSTALPCGDSSCFLNPYAHVVPHCAWFLSRPNRVLPCTSMWCYLMLPYAHFRLVPIAPGIPFCSPAVPYASQYNAPLLLLLLPSTVLPSSYFCSLVLPATPHCSPVLSTAPRPFVRSSHLLTPTTRPLQILQPCQQRHVGDWMLRYKAVFERYFPLQKGDRVNTHSITKSTFFMIFGGWINGLEEGATQYFLWRIRFGRTSWITL